MLRRQAHCEPASRGIGPKFTPDEESEPVKIESILEVGRPPGVKPGTPLAVPFAA
jgi:hypothetical protein